MACRAVLVPVLSNPAFFDVYGASEERIAHVHQDPRGLPAQVKDEIRVMHEAASKVGRQPKPAAVTTHLRRVFLKTSSREVTMRLMGQRRVAVPTVMKRA